LIDGLESIIKDCIAGKSSARERLYKLLAPQMWPVCLRYAPGADDARDIMQDGFVKVFENIKKYEGRGAFEGWVRRIMVNTALATYRRRNMLYIEHENYPESENSDFHALESNLSVKELLAVIQELSPQYRMVFNLYAVEGYSHKEIAEMLGISEGTSKSNLSRAREILQQKLNILNSFRLNLG
jgi:RNA polymerase sigma factor (sigma-70 family)